MFDTLRDSLGRNASFKLGVLLLLAAMLPCYCIGGILLVISNNSIRTAPSPTAATLIANQPTATPTVEGRPSITPFGVRPTSLPALQFTPTDINLNVLTPGAYSTYDTRTLFPPDTGGGAFPPEPVTTLAVTPGNIESGSPLAQCPDADGSISTVIRTNASGGVAPGASIYCRALTNQFSIGSQTVLERGVQVAVEIYAFNGGSSVTRFQQSLRVCLLGQGVFWFLDANNAPRTAAQLTPSSEGDYTCADVPNAGTVVLTYR